MNKCIFNGRLTKDPQVTHFENTSVANFTIAVENYNSKTKEKGADFIPIVVWGNQADFAENYLTKGTFVNVEGRFSSRSYKDNEVNTRYVNEIVAYPTGIKSLSKITKLHNESLDTQVSNEGVPFANTDSQMVI